MVRHTIHILSLIRSLMRGVSSLFVLLSVLCCAVLCFAVQDRQPLREYLREGCAEAGRPYATPEAHSLATPTPFGTDVRSTCPVVI